MDTTRIQTEYHKKLTSLNKTYTHVWMYNYGRRITVYLHVVKRNTRNTSHAPFSVFLRRIFSDRD